MLGKRSHRVRGCQVDSDPTGTSPQQEEKGLRVGVGETVDRRLSFLAHHAAVEAFIGVVTQPDVVLDQVQQQRELQRNEWTIR